MQYESKRALPLADDQSAAHSQRVRLHIQRKIDAAGGQISFAEFMHEAMYAPGLGYYAAGSTKFGPDGDFVTAPEISPVFGRVLARQMAEVLSAVSGGEVLEFGAGSGRLAADCLAALEALGALPQTYNILEVSADLAARQRDCLQAAVPHLLERVCWLSSPPPRFRGVVVANEVLDALPFECFARSGSQTLQRCVAVKNSELVWVDRPAGAQLAIAVSDIEADIGASFADGYRSEISLAARHWIVDVAAMLTEGAVFLFDYGLPRRELYASDRSDGWLRCHFRHHAHNDPLILPGIQDLTTWVDFTAIAAAAVDNGLELLGFQTQSQFLMGGGLQEEMRDFATLPVPDQVLLSGQVKMLTLPGEMGENFKFIALGCGDIDAPTAFDFADRTQSL